MPGLARFAALAAAVAAAAPAGAAAQTPAPSATQSLPPSLFAPKQATGAGLRQALQAARARDLAGARAAQAGLDDPVARTLVDWALADVFGGGLGPSEIARLNRELAGWPREEARQRAVESAALPRGPIPYTALSASSAAPRTQSFRERRLRMNDAVRAGDAHLAYQHVSTHGMAPGGVDYADAEFFAGWLALTRLRNPAQADRHFARLEAAVTSPVSKARAAYWRGRAAEALGDAAGAKAFYERGAEHSTTFYGQLAAERAGRREIVLERDPTPTAAERVAFESQPMVHALDLLSAAGEKELVRVFALHLGERVQSRTELAMLMDKLKGMGEREVTLLAYRRGAQKGYILHERGYPLISPPRVDGGAEPALVLSIVRQESQFDPTVRSGADARGMMQILPGTGREMARKIGVAWDEGLLWDPVQNMRLGSRYLGHLTGYFSGSYVMATAGYNAGPGRPNQWVQFCGDPRLRGVDPLDFIECIPFSETRNYVMNVLSNLQVYRARLNNGRSALTLTSDLRRGAPMYRPTETATSDSPGESS